MILDNNRELLNEFESFLQDTNIDLFINSPEKIEFINKIKKGKESISLSDLDIMESILLRCKKEIYKDNDSIILGKNIVKTFKKNTIIRMQQNKYVKF